MRLLADILTASRLGIAAFIVYAGVEYGTDAFGAVAAAVLLGWTLDTLDGHLARAASNPQPSWLGRHERQFDAVMVVAGFLYLTLSGIIPVWVCATYLVLSALLLFWFRSIAVMTVLEGPLALLVPVVAFFLEPFWGWMFVLWSAVAAILDRRRLRVRVRILWEDAQRLRKGVRQGDREGAGQH
jgi:phosphatidylglycerophosphate synthase